MHQSVIDGQFNDLKASLGLIGCTQSESESVYTKEGYLIGHIFSIKITSTVIDLEDDPSYYTDTSTSLPSNSTCPPA